MKPESLGHAERGRPSASSCRKNLILLPLVLQSENFVSHLCVSPLVMSFQFLSSAERTVLTEKCLKLGISKGQHSPWATFESLCQKCYQNWVCMPKTMKMSNNMNIKISYSSCGRSTAYTEVNQLALIFQTMEQQVYILSSIDTTHLSFLSEQALQ